LIGSGRSAGEVSDGDQFRLCRYWHDPAAGFEEVVAIGRKGPRVRVEFVSGPEKGETANVFASSLWTPEQLDFAQERRGRDLAIADIDRENPVDPVDWSAVEICCGLVSEDTAVEYLGTLRAVLVLLDRPVEVSELHELAYTDGAGYYADVSAPKIAWQQLFEELVRSKPELIEQLSVADLEKRYRRSARRNAAAVAVLRRWAGLAQVAPALKPGAMPAAVDDRRRSQKIIKRIAAELIAAADRPAKELRDSFQSYRKAREGLDGGDLSTMKEWEARRVIWGFAEHLSQAAERWAEPPMTWLMRDVAVRGFRCDHIVWSGYSAQHPRTLHLFPDGHLYPEEERAARQEWGPVTACGKQVLLGPGDRSWYRAERGEWLEHYEALLRHKADQAERDEHSGFPYLDPNFESARRICGTCSTYHGLYLECLEPAQGASRWPSWKSVEMRKVVERRLSDRSEKGGVIKSLKSAQKLSMEAWLDVEIGALAAEVKQRGAGPLRRLFGEREFRSPSRYEEWAMRSQRAGLEPYELLSEAMWIQLLTQSLPLYSEQDAVPFGERKEFRDLLVDVLEARLAAL